MENVFTDLDGVFAGGLHVGLKANPSRKDLAFIYVPNAVASAGVFTKNQCPAYCITHTRNVLKRNIMKAVVINSGNANARSGKDEAKHTKQMAKATAESLGILPSEVGVASTGIIGVPLPMDVVESGIRTLLSNETAKDAMGAAEGILTTDLTTKMAYHEQKIGKKTFVVAGITKGSGMIAPNMATTLTFLVTNASLSSGQLQEFLKKATEDSFNMMSVDTDTSTNDMILLFSTGEHKFPLHDKEDAGAYQALLTDTCIDLAKQIARDGEGAKKLIEVRVNGAASTSDAKKIAKSIVESPLVKTAVAGADPNWGRVMMAVGKTEGVKLNPEKLDISFGGVPVFAKGDVIAFDLDTAKKGLSGTDVCIEVGLNLNTGKATAWGCDLTEGYIHINTEYN